jgi:hypothetical protein
MIATIDNFQVDLSKPIDISIPLSNTDDNPIAWYVENQLLKLFVWGMGGESRRYVLTNFNNILLTLMVTERIPNVWGISRTSFIV